MKRIAISRKNHVHTLHTLVKALVPPQLAVCVNQAASQRATVAQVAALDKPANVNGLTRLPTLDDIDARIESKEVEMFDSLVLLLLLDDIEVKDEARLLQFTLREFYAAVDWLGYRHASASDYIVRKKRLLQPACCVGILEEKRFLSPANNR